MKSVLKYPGAKNRLATWIIQHIPEHKVYIEPYFGSGAVFFNKKPAQESLRFVVGKDLDAGIGIKMVSGEE